MERLIDCSSYDTAVKSIARVFGVSTEKMIAAIRSVESYENEFTDKTYVYQAVCGQLGDPRSGFKAVWFHGTRTHDISDFHKEGILPKSQAKARIVSKLQLLAQGLEHSGDYPHALSLSAKQTQQDEGPFAFLIRDAVVFAPGSAHSYTKRPELVEDMAGVMLGGNYEFLVEKFCGEAKPYVIAFKGEADEYELMHAVWYLYLLDQKVDILNEGGIERCCFSAEGEAVLPSEILKIEEL